MDDVFARGSNFCYAKEYVIKVYGENVWQKLLASLPSDLADIWDRSLLITEVYSFSAFKTMVKTLSQLVDSETDQKTSIMYEYIADRSLNSIYKLFSSITSPSFVIKNYPKLWKRFFTIGEVGVKEAHKGYAHIKFNFPEIFLDWLPPACHGYSKKAVEIADGKNVNIKEKLQRGDGFWDIKYELFWKE